MHTGPFDHFERFDTGDDIMSEADFTSQVLRDSPSRVPPFSPMPPLVPDHDDPMMSKEMEVEEQHPQSVQHEVQMSPQKEPDLCRPLKRKARGNCSKVIIDLQTMIPSETYHSWLNDASDISSLRRKRMKPATDLLRSTKIDVLMDLPPLCVLSSSGNYLHEMHYPELLMELWRKSSLGNPQTPPVHQNRTSHSFPEEAQYQEFSNIRGDFGIHKMMAEEDHSFAPTAVLGGFTSSGSHGEASQTIHSSEPLTSGRSNKRQTSLSIGNLYTVAEEVIMPGLETLVETGPTQTPYGLAVEPALDKVTESIRKQLKSHFDTPGNSQAESLNNLADGLTRKRAALLFYHTCVMATMDYVKVEQLVPYGDISISRGSKM
ncbi:Sister chromatid cohesion 1 protein 1 [Platanthera guangdongensis]|uniref:Sister chromatid cohesion 1 protein 1 n=1 Tax=Platanthera guangdongensis TaxID=2320717 RepID=A0ABR2MBK0_9ASPA